MFEPSKVTSTTLVMLPGFDGSGRLFDLFEAELIQKIPKLNIVAVSYPATEALSYIDLLKIVEAQLPATDYYLLAESFSGPLGIMLAACSSQSNFKGLILVGTFCKSPSYLLQWLKPLIPSFSALAHSLLKADNRFKEFIINKLLLALVFKKSTQNALTKITSTLTALGEKTISMRLSEVAKVNVAQELTAINKPILYLKAAQDFVIPPRCAAAITKIKPTVQTETVTGGHLLLRANPQKCAELVAEFIESTSIAATDK